jgi:hypothetical protein
VSGASRESRRSGDDGDLRGEAEVRTDAVGGVGEYGDVVGDQRAPADEVEAYGVGVTVRVWTATNCPSTSAIPMAG